MNRERGFTLVEVLVAFAILAVSLSALYTSFNSSLLRTRRDAQLSEATLLAESLIARGTREWTNDTSAVTGSWQEFQYQVTQHTDPAPMGMPPYTVPTVRLVAEVSWPADGRTRHVELSSLRLAANIL